MLSILMISVILLEIIIYLLINISKNLKLKNLEKKYSM